MMKKKSFSDLGCHDFVKTMQKQQEESGPAQSYRQKARAVVARMRKQHRHTPQGEVCKELRAGMLSSQHHLQAAPEVQKPNLQALVYQTRYSPNPMLRKEALEGLFLSSRFSKATIEALETALDDKDACVRETAAGQLASFPPPLTDVLLDKLIARVWDPEMVVRKKVAETLAHHPDPRAIGPLMGLLGTPDDDLRFIVHKSLIEITEQLGPPPPRSGGDV